MTIDHGPRPEIGEDICITLQEFSSILAQCPTPAGDRTGGRTGTILTLWDEMRTAHGTHPGCCLHDDVPEGRKDHSAVIVWPDVRDTASWSFHRLDTPGPGTLLRAEPTSDSSVLQV